MSKIKVLCLSTWYPLSMSRYFEKAFRHREDLDFKTCGVYTGSWIPWQGGMNLPEKYAIPPDLALPFRFDTQEINYEMVKAQLGDWVPDLIVNIDAGVHWKYKPSDGLVVTVGTDPHVLNDFYDAPRKYSDKFFSMQKVYAKAGDLWLPYAYSKYDFYPENDWYERDVNGGYLHHEYIKDIDAAIIGLQYTHVPRVQLVEELRKRGLNVFSENGPVFDEARAIYNRTKIGLNWSTMEDLNCRAFELPAMRILPVMNFVPDMQEFEFVKNCRLFTDLSSAVEQVLWAIQNPDDAKEQAELAYQKVLPHTYDERVTQLLKETGFVV